MKLGHYPASRVPWSSCNSSFPSVTSQLLHHSYRVRVGWSTSPQCYSGGGEREWVSSMDSYSRTHSVSFSYYLVSIQSPEFNPFLFKVSGSGFHFLYWSLGIQIKKYVWVTKGRLLWMGKGLYFRDFSQWAPIQVTEPYFVPNTGLVAGFMRQRSALSGRTC